MIVNYVINSIFTKRSKHFSLFCILQPPQKKKFSKKRTKELCVSDIDEILELVFLSEN